MRNLSVLIVDDDSYIRDLFITVFSTSLRWKTIFPANNGIEALEALQKQKFDLLFTDRTMPGMLGEELIWRAKLIQPEMKVIFMSGDDIDVLKEVAANVGADKILQKPANFLEIINAVNSLFPEN